MTMKPETMQRVNWIRYLIIAGGVALGPSVFSQISSETVLPGDSIVDPAVTATVEVAAPTEAIHEPEATSGSVPGSVVESTEASQPLAADQPATPALDEILALPAPVAQTLEESDAAVSPPEEATKEIPEASSLDALLALPTPADALEANPEQSIPEPVAEPATMATGESTASEEVSPKEGAPALEADSQRVAEEQVIIRKERDEQGRRFLQEAEQLLADGKYKAAADKYDAALKELTERPENDGLRSQAKTQAASALFELAQTEYERDNLDEARKNALDAKSRDSSLTASADSLLRRLDKSAERAGRIAQIPTPVRDRTEVLEKQKNIEDLFNEGRRWFAIEEYDKAETVFESILLKDPNHRDAMRFLRRIEERRLAARETYRKATIAGMIEQVRSRWTPPIHQSSQEPNQQSGQGPDEVAPGQRALREKMQKIIIPSIEFRQANVVDVITFLQEASAAADPDGTGVSFILKLGLTGTGSPSPVATPDSSDPWDTPSADAAAAPSSMDAAGTPSITMNLRKVSLLDAIKYITELASLRYRIEEFAVIIVPMNAVLDTMVTRFYPVQPTIQEITIDKGKNQADDFTQPEEGLNSSETKIRRVNDMQAFFEKMGVKFPPGSSISYNPAISQLIVANTPENLDKLESILPQINVIPSQIEIESRFVEINQDDLAELGFEWLLTDDWQVASKKGTGPAMAQPRIQVNANNTGAGTLGFTKGLRYLASTSTEPTPTPTSRTTGTADSMLGNILSLSGILTNPELNVVLHALERSGGADLLSAPRITTKSGSPAQIQVVKEILYPTEFEQQDIGAVSIAGVGVTDAILRRPPIPSQFEKRGIGVILNATPTVGPDGYTIDLTLVPEVSELVSWVNYGPPGEYPIYQPIFASRNVTTSIVLWDGHTVAMGGLIRETVKRMDDKIPLLGDIPVLGRLFQSKGEYSGKKNLIIFVTARLIDPSGNAIRTADATSTGAAELK